MYSGHSSQQADPFDDAVATLFGVESQAVSDRPVGQAANTIHDAVTGETHRRHGEENDHSAPSHQRLGSVEDLIEQFEHRHFTRQMERLLSFPATPPDQLNLELERAEQWAERTRAKLRTLTSEHLPVINCFIETAQIGDFEAIDRILESLAGHPAELGSLLTELWLSP